MANELDMDAYHSEGIDPGEHKVFNITPTIHSFNERFQGESPVSAGPGLEGYDPDKMPDWWTKVLKPNTQWPGEGLNYEPEPMPGNSTFNTITKDAFFQPISDKGPKPPLSIPELDIPLVHKPSINKDVFNPTVGRPPAKLSESLSNVEKGIKEGLDAGKSTYEIANEIGMSQSGLRHYMNKRGWKSQYSQVGGENALSAYTKDQDKQLLSLQKQGMSFSQIAKETGLTRGKVAGRLSRLNYANQFEGGPVEGQFRGMEAANDNLGRKTYKGQFRGMKPEDFNVYDEDYNAFNLRKERMSETANDNPGRKTYNLLDLLPYDVEK